MTVEQDMTKLQHELDTILLEYAHKRDNTPKGVGRIECLDKAIEEIIQLMPRWVKCAERNPTNEKRKLIQYEEHGVKATFIGRYNPISERWDNLLGTAVVIQWLDGCPDPPEIEQ